MSADHIKHTPAEKNTRKAFIDVNKIITRIQKILNPDVTFIAGSYTLACAMNGVFMPNDVDIYINMNIDDFDKEIERIVSCLRAVLDNQGFSMKRTIVSGGGDDAIYSFCDKITAITTIKITNIPPMQFVCISLPKNITDAIAEFRNISDKIGSVVMMFSASANNASDVHERWLDVPLHMNNVIATRAAPRTFFATESRMQKYILHGFAIT